MDLLKAYRNKKQILTGNERQVLYAVLFRELSISQVARDMGISRQAAHEMYTRGVSKLKRTDNLYLLEQPEKYENVLRSRFKSVDEVAEFLNGGGNLWGMYYIGPKTQENIISKLKKLGYDITR